MLSLEERERKRERDENGSEGLLKIRATSNERVLSGGLSAHVRA